MLTYIDHTLSSENLFDLSRPLSSVPGTLSDIIGDVAILIKSSKGPNEIRFALQLVCPSEIGFTFHGIKIS